MLDDDVRRGARWLEASERLTRERMEGLTAPSLRDQWALEALRASEGLIVPLGSESTALARGASRFVPPPLLESLHDELAQLREINERFVGLRISQAQVMLDGDPRVTQMQGRLREWAGAFVAARLARVNRRDRGDPFLRFCRIYEELVPHLERVAFHELTVSRIFMGEFTDYLPWLLFERTWKDRLEHEVDPGELIGRYRVRLDDPAAREAALGFVQIYAWTRANDLEIVLGRMAPAPPTPRDVRARLQRLASDVHEMRPFLSRNFKPERVLIELPGGLVGNWLWKVGPGIGVVPVATSKIEMRKQHRRRMYAPTLLVRHDGRLAVNALPWVHLEGDRLGRNLELLERLHERLWALFERVDLDKILNRWRGGRRPRNTEPTEEEVAASCQLAGEAEEASSRNLGGRIRTLRVKALLRILSERLGCEVRPGKGSEMVVFRPGGHHFRIGRHKRNEIVTSMLVKTLLTQVGIGFDEWLAALGG